VLVFIRIVTIQIYIICKPSQKTHSLAL